MRAGLERLSAANERNERTSEISGSNVPGFTPRALLKAVCRFGARKGLAVPKALKIASQESRSKGLDQIVIIPHWAGPGRHLFLFEHSLTTSCVRLTMLVRWVGFYKY